MTPDWLISQGGKPKVFFMLKGPMPEKFRPLRWLRPMVNTKITFSLSLPDKKSKSDETDDEEDKDKDKKEEDLTEEERKRRGM